ncbi:hypothetical protein JNK13_00905 [bacterium]|nr:hypothetical protein [bacterium]
MVTRNKLIIVITAMLFSMAFDKFALAEKSHCDEPTSMPNSICQDLKISSTSISYTFALNHVGGREDVKGLAAKLNRLCDGLSRDPKYSQDSCPDTNGECTLPYGCADGNFPGVCSYVNEDKSCIKTAKAKLISKVKTTYIYELRNETTCHYTCTEKLNSSISNTDSSAIY